MFGGIWLGIFGILVGVGIGLFITNHLLKRIKANKWGNS
jgi:hypothetical protein